MWVHCERLERSGVSRTTRCAHRTSESSVFILEFLLCVLQVDVAGGDKALKV